VGGVARLTIALLQWAAGWVLLWRIPTPEVERTTRPRRARSVVVPARNEADNLTRLLPSLAGEEVTVVDDDSDDGTADVARDLGATVVVPGPPPAGWTGKAWACAAGAEATAPAGERLVFLDADVVLEPGGLDRIVAAHDELAPDGLLSVQPFHTVRRPYEQLSAFFNLVGMAGIDAFTPLGRRVAPTGAFGPCLVLRRTTYEAAGGHAAASVRGAILDDVELARAVRTATGGPVVVLGGRGSIRFRMYPHGLAQLVEGWTKNLAGGARRTRPLTLLLVIAWIGVLVEAPTTHPLLYAACAVQLLVLLRRVGTFSPLTALLYPIPLAFFLAVFVRSVVRTFVRHEVRWRGRSVRT
jgi:4,4'-diaponeurosporenoate glycosyltransferase